MEIVEVG